MKLLVSLLFLTVSLMASSQTLEKHKWEHRILLVICGEIDNQSTIEDYSKQLQIIKYSAQGFKERKLMVYAIFSDRYRLLTLPTVQESQWTESPELFTVYNKQKKPFKIVLIGLDGGIKAERTSLISSQELFDIIDGMPMRRSEMKRKNKPYP